MRNAVVIKKERELNVSVRGIVNMVVIDIVDIDSFTPSMMSS